MATTTLTNNLRRDLLNGVLDLSADTIMIALYVSTAHDADTGAYTTVGEASGTNYVAAGNTLTGAAQATDNDVSYYDWADSTWSASTITAADCMVFDDTVTTPTAKVSIYIGDFGGSKSSSNGAFTVTMPGAAATTALVRLA